MINLKRNIRRLTPPITDIVPANQNKDTMAIIAKKKDEIDSLIEVKAVYDEKDRLATHITFLEGKVKILEDENQSLKERLSTKRRKDDDKSKEEIRKHFAVKPLGKGVSIFSLIAMISMCFKTVRTSLNGVLGINNNIIGIIFIVLLIIILLYWIFKCCQKLKINDLISKLNDPGWMERNISIKKTTTYSSIEYYISQSDIHCAVSREIKSNYSKYLFPFKQNIVIDLITNHIINHYLDAEVMKIGDSAILDRHFDVKKPDYIKTNDTNEVPF